MRELRYALIACAVLCLLGAGISFVVLFDRIETTTTVLAGAATACACAAGAIPRKERPGR